MRIEEGTLLRLPPWVELHYLVTLSALTIL